MPEPDKVTADLDLLVRARYPLLALLTYEERRASELLGALARRQKKNLLQWDVNDGLRLVEGPHHQPLNDPLKDPLDVLRAIMQFTPPSFYILKDFHPYLKKPEVARQLRDCASALQRSFKTVFLLSPEIELPMELEKAVTLVDLPVPDEAAMGKLFEDFLVGARRNERVKVDLNPADRERIVRGVMGLTLEEAERVFSRALLKDLRIDGGDVTAVLEEKKQIVRKSGVLEYYSAEESLSDVGGLELLKVWVGQRSAAFQEKARAFGIPRAKGVLILGVQGCGKSLAAKAIASAWRLPLLRLDVGRLFSAYIGSSESNMRRALKTAESVAPAVLWIDEIEKAFSGVQSSGATDAGTASRIFGTFLTWMQESPAQTFVVATANQIEHLPPELMRKGRFDEIFFVDLPGVEERAEILRIHLLRRKRDPAGFDVAGLAKAADQFSGAELEQAVISALFEAFQKGRDLATEDLLKALHASVPLAVTMQEQIAALRSWARLRTRPAAAQAGTRA
jgi:ATP-dependent 26S proteasome regulatory subunit